MALARAAVQGASRFGVRCLSRLAVPARTAPIRRAPCIPPYTLNQARRFQSTEVEAPDYLTEGELAIFEKLKAELEPTKLEVQDVSGGCGSMYALDIVSHKFKGLTIIKQHRLVNEILGEEIKQWHGVQLRTKAL